MFITNDWSVLINATVYSVIVTAIVGGIAASTNILDSGLNSFGSMLTFSSVFSTVLYISLIAGEYGKLGIPYESVLDIFSTLLYVLGFFFLITSRSGGE